MVARVTGRVGEVRWGYRAVASFGSWSLDLEPDGGSLTAQITACDDYGITQTPLVLVVPAGQTTWRWPVRELTVAGTTLTATVGPREARDE